MSRINRDDLVTLTHLIACAIAPPATAEHATEAQVDGWIEAADRVVDLLADLQLSIDIAPREFASQLWPDQFPAPATVLAAP
jgi:hypothetical protein